MAEITAALGYKADEWAMLTEPQQVGYEQQLHFLHKRRAQYIAAELAEIMLAVMRRP
jgi:hypothetical protein